MKQASYRRAIEWIVLNDDIEFLKRRRRCSVRHGGDGRGPF